MARISVLGTGRMGAALATAFASAGHTVTVWNRTAAAAKRLEGAGVRVAPSLLDAMAADLVVDIVSDYEASAALVRNADVARALRDRTLLELASGTPKQAQNAAAWAQQHGIRYVDGAIMSTPDFIGRPGCTILYSGPSDVFEAHRTTLEAIADHGVYVGSEVGHANVLDNAILGVLWGCVHGTFLGAAICEAEKFPLAAFSDTLDASWPVVLPLLRSAIERVGNRHWAADATTQSTVAPCQASARHILAISKEHGIDTALPDAFVRLFQRAVEAGHRDDDVAAAYEGMSRAAR